MNVNIWCLSAVLISLSICACQESGAEKIKKTEVNSTADAVTDLSDKILAAPNDKNLYIERALLYADRQLFDLAERDIQRALSIDSTATEIHCAMGEVYFRARKLRDARLAFERAMEFDPKNTSASLKLAEVNFLLRRYDDAMIAINEALRVNERLAKGYFLKGFIYKETGDTTLAISSFQTAAEVDPEYFEAFMELGNLYAFQRNELALEYFNTALTIQSKSAEALYHKGMFYQQEGNLDAALATYRALINADPKGYLGYYNTGYLYLVAAQSYDTAIAYFDTVLVLQPGFVDAMYNKGLAFEELKSEQAAIDLYRNVLDIDPQYTLAAMGLERLLE